MKTDNASTRAKKTRQAKPQPSKSDFFTILCHSDLKIECVKEHKFHPTRKWRFDYAIPAHKIALEVEGGVWTGGRHTSPKGFLNDMEKYNTATTVPELLCTNATLAMIRQAMNHTIVSQITP